MLKAVALVCLLAQLTDGYKILVFSPTMSRSHMIFNARVADALAKDGHNVVSVLPNLSSAAKAG